MDLRTHYPFSLLKAGLVKSYPSLDKHIHTEVAVMGAGITGALVSFHLQNEGLDCVVVDRRHVAMGSTAASTSLIQYEIDQPLHRLVELVGYKNAVRSYELTRQSIYDLEQICTLVDNKDSFQKKNSLQYASFKKDVPGLEKEYAMRKQHGFNVDMLDASMVKDQFTFEAPAALLSHEAAQVDAYGLTHKIFSSLDPQLCRVFDHTNIVSVKHEKNKIVLVTADGFTISAKKLVIACGYESGRYTHKKIETLRCTYAIISEPMRQKEFWKDNCLIWETADPYLYIRTTEDNRVLVGGKDTAYLPIEDQIQMLPQKSKALQKNFQKLFPHLPLKIDFSWAGAFAATKDGLPYIGSIPGIAHTYFALGYGGNGITFSLMAAQMISGAIKGRKQPDMDIFAFNRP